MFRNALQTEEIRLRVHRPVPRHSGSSMQDSSGPVSPKVHGLFKSVPPPPPQRSPNTALSTQTSTSSLPRHPPQISPTHPTSAESQADNSSGVMQASSRKLGKKLHIELTKGMYGFI